MQGLMILWRSWFLAPQPRALGPTGIHSTHTTRELRADILAILAAKKVQRS